MIPGEHLIGALAGLHYLDVSGYFLAEQVERHTVMADHRFAHGPDGFAQGREHALLADPDLVVIGVEAPGNDV